MESLSRLLQDEHLGHQDMIGRRAIALGRIGPRHDVLQRSAKSLEGDHTAKTLQRIALVRQRRQALGQIAETRLINHTVSNSTAVARKSRRTQFGQVLGGVEMAALKPCHVLLARPMFAMTGQSSAQLGTGDRASG
jgi:hypothetical protein